MNDFDSNKNNVVLEIKKLVKDYVTDSETIHVLKGVELSVLRASRISIIGESGNGKSTLLNILGGIDVATSGFVRAGDYTLTKMGEDDLTEYRSKFVGLVFQFHYLLKDFSAQENIFLPLYMTGVKKNIAMEKASALLNDVGLYERRNHLPSQLSGGERQRVAVARALVNDPSLILADEPTGNLDPENSKMIGELLFNIAEQYQKTLIVVTHDMSLSKRAQICYQMKEGRLFKQDSQNKDAN